ncbi:uncharacterized protein LOC124924332 [Impatiens glandulifera]|uniref:uncharacterized protein LOC124924332 n=1 Tax=Impatiens glandulifera TaxID=253017 RepID=UPI001FB0AFA4|nr:uncharacterized protein LOC124924332 [Impatiens glandulifera]
MGCIEPTNSGNLFTWSSTRGDERIRKSRIDRCLVNENWINQFPRSQLHVLNLGIYDHCPIKLFREKEERFKISFKFFNFWMENDKFKDILQSVWSTDVRSSNMYRVFEKLKILKNQLQSFDKKKFSNISSRVLVTREELEEV